MSWILNLWNRLKGRGQFANPLARLVERDDVPEVYIKCVDDFIKLDEMNKTIIHKFSVAIDSIPDAYKDSYAKMTDSFK
jgi:hypothetical protein